MTDPNPAVIVHNFSIIATILEDISIGLGLGLVLGGFLTLKRWGAMRTFMSHQMTLAWPMIMVLSGAMLIALPATVSTVMNSFWSDSNPLRYFGTTDGWSEYIPAILVFVRLIGIGAIMRGIMLFSRAGRTGQSQPGTISRAMLHVFGGIALVHILGTVHLLKSILDITT